MTVREKQVQLAVEIGVEKCCPPTHPREGNGGEPGCDARVLELAAVDVAIDRVAIVGEGCEDEVHAGITVEVASVGAHPRLCAGIAIHGDASGEPHALEFPRAQVAIEKVRVRVVGDEQIHEPVVVIVGCHDAEPVRARPVGKAVSVGRFLETGPGRRFRRRGRIRQEARQVQP